MKTDEEIIKGLDFCCNTHNCLNCPYLKVGMPCIRIMQSDALSLIKKQQAKINRLERYDEERDIALHAKLIKNSKAEAIREFWNRLKAQNTMDERIISVKSGDELIEEMAGDK